MKINILTLVRFLMLRLWMWCSTYIRKLRLLLKRMKLFTWMIIVSIKSTYLGFVAIFLMLPVNMLSILKFFISFVFHNFNLLIERKYCILLSFFNFLHSMLFLILLMLKLSSLALMLFIILIKIHFWVKCVKTLNVPFSLLLLLLIHSFYTRRHRIHLITLHILHFHSPR